LHLGHGDYLGNAWWTWDDSRNNHDPSNPAFNEARISVMVRKRAISMTYTTLPEPCG
jgi:hypothetical protein